MDESNPVRIKDEISQGIVEVCTNNSFLGVCNSGWNDKAASTLCVELGFSRYGMQTAKIWLCIKIIILYYLHIQYVHLEE